MIATRTNRKTATRPNLALRASLWIRVWVWFALSSFIFGSTIGAAFAQSGLRSLRDSEIEALVRDYSVPIFQAARVNYRSVQVHIINDTRFNAFVANGQRIFINAGALMDSETPNEIIGVIAHETAHIAGGHLARQREALERAQSASIITMLIGIGAIAAGGAAGNSSAGQAGAAVLSGGQNAVLRALLSYRRSEEAAADQGAVRYLTATGQSAKGMMITFARFADQQLFSSRNIDPYFQSHPMARDRVSALQSLAETSPFFDRVDPPALQLRHDLMRAKLFGFLEHRDSVFRRYPRSNTSLAARYARAIATYLHVDVNSALTQIDDLIRAQPNNPYFWELRGQALLESGRPSQAIEPLRKSVALAPDAGLIRMLLGQALVATDEARHLDDAIRELTRAITYEPNASVGLRQLAIAYGRKGDIARAEMMTARAYLAEGDLNQAKQHAARVQRRVARGAPLWIQADDIINFQPPS